MKVVINGNWGPYIGTEYCDALGIFDSLENAELAALAYAWNLWEGSEDEGPDFWIEEYNPQHHDQLRSGGGSFEIEFENI